jgi:hypothetical protein
LAVTGVVGVESTGLRALSQVEQLRGI